MFSAEPSAKSAMDFDPKGFIINGKRTYVSSGSIHYPRVPKALWRDRLMRLKRTGFNTVETYVFWNYHEPKENVFDFADEKDFEAFLDLSQELGLYAIVRAGPYVCAEWDSGGYPVWTKFKPGVIARKDDPGFIEMQNHWYAKILPMVAKHQISKGGNIILLQLENEGEMWGAWPEDGQAPNGYWKSIYDAAKRHGIEIPWFMSGYNHGSMPILEDPDNSKRLCPWISTEIWAGWFTSYGSSDYGFMRTYRINAKLLARGAAGHNYYMFHGGSNFETWNDDETASSYDYGATMGQAGDLRPVHVRLKGNNLFSNSFGEILANATDATEEYLERFAHNARVIGARKSPAGTIVFLEGKFTNNDPAVVAPHNGGARAQIHIPPQEIAPIVLDAPIVTGADNIKIIEAAVRVLGIARHGTTTTLIVQGQPGDVGAITLERNGQKRVVNVEFPTGQPQEIVETVGAQQLRILTMSNQLADRTWVVGKKDAEYIVTGPEYVGEFNVDSTGKASLQIERPYGHVAPDKVIVYGPVGTAPQYLAVTPDPKVKDDAPAPALGGWSVAQTAEFAPNFDDSSWQKSEDPQQMGADGDVSAFAWYRASFNAPQAGSGTLNLPGAADHLIVFINGQRCKATPSVENPPPTSDTLKKGELSWTVSADFQAGANTIAILATHQGRDKGGKGEIATFFQKGIFKPAFVELGGKKIDVKNWKLRGGLPALGSLKYQAGIQTPDAPAFFQTTFNAPRPGIGANPIYRVFVTGSDTGLTRGTVFLNGRCLGRYPEVTLRGKEPVPVYLPECWFNADGKNTLVIFDEEGRVPSSAVKLEIEAIASREVIAVSQPAEAASIQLPPYEPHIIEAQMSAALEKPVTVSSSTPDGRPFSANDADDQTWWRPAAAPTEAEPAWIQFDLLAPKNLLTTEIFFRDQAALYPLLLEGSEDGKTWKTMLDRRKIDPNAERKDFRHIATKLENAENVRYVRLTVFGELDPQKPFRLAEFRVWDVYHTL